MNPTPDTTTLLALRHYLDAIATNADSVTVLKRAEALTVEDWNLIEQYNSQVAAHTRSAPDVRTVPGGGGLESGRPTTRRGIYVASRASIPERPAMWRALRDEGYPIVSTWINAPYSQSAADLWRRVCRETRGAAVVLYAPPEDGPWKGAFVEVGLALGTGGHVFVAGDHQHLGSWVWSPGVTLCADVRDAMNAARLWAESDPGPLGALRRAMWADDIQPNFPPTPGAPMCSDHACPSYDGKRCRVLGSRPSSICEPAADRAFELLAVDAEPRC